MTRTDFKDTIEQRGAKTLKWLDGESQRPEHAFIADLIRLLLAEREQRKAEPHVGVDAMIATSGQWGMVSSALDGEKLPESVNVAICGLCDGTLKVVAIDDEQRKAEPSAQAPDTCAYLSGTTPCKYGQRKAEQTVAGYSGQHFTGSIDSDGKFTPEPSAGPVAESVFVTEADLAALGIKYHPLTEQGDPRWMQAAEYWKGCCEQECEAHNETREKLERIANHPPATAPESEAVRLIAELYKVFGIGVACDLNTVLVNASNAARRSRCLSAIEEELTIRTPSDDSEEWDEECLLNWGQEPAQYIETFRAAIATLAQSQAQGGEQKP